MRLVFYLIGLSFGILSCDFQADKLPYYGRHEVNKAGDSIYYKIPDFTFLNQDSIEVSQSTLSDHIYVADFFFTTCPSICPIMNRNLLQVQKAFAEDSRLKIVSHTLDPEYDLPFRLKEYAKNLTANTNQWMFLWASKEYTYDIAEKYYIAAVEGENYPGGINHSGKLVLVDKNGNIRGFYEGTQQYGIDELIKDIPILLKEY